MTPDTWKAIFDGPCQLHDFGYRNFGSGLTLERTEGRRSWIDSKFRTEMRNVCKSWKGLEKFTCNTAANTMYGAVRTANHW